MLLPRQVHASARPLLRALLLAALPGLGLAGLVGAASDPTRDLRPVEAQILEITDAAGPPATSCEEARAAVAKPLAAAPTNAPATPKKTSSRAPAAEPDYAAMQEVVVDGATRRKEDLPGSTPDALPLTALEGPPSALAKVAAVMKQAEDGERTRLTFFGASHVGGEFWTGRIRRALQSRHGDLGHGFVLPAALYEGYRATDVNLCRTDDWFPDWAGKLNGRDDGLLGPGGMSVSSRHDHSFGWIETTRTNPHGRKVSLFDVYALGQPGGGRLELTVDGAAPRVVSTAAPAPTLLRWRLTLEDGPHRLALSPAGDGEVRLFGVSAEREGGGVIVDGIGVRGRTARSWLAWNRTMANQGLLALDPDMVVLAYGTNEAADLNYTAEEYRTDLRAVLGELRRALPEVACVLVGPSDRAVEQKPGSWRIWSRTAMIAGVQRETAPEFDCAFWDLQQASGGAGSMVAWRLLEPPLAAGDLIHFTTKGYELLGDRFVAALDAAR